MMDPGFSLLAMLLCGLGALLLIVGIVLIVGRLLGAHGDGPGRARSLLDRRLASGEIDVDEYYERESALRQAVPAPRRFGRR